MTPNSRGTSGGPGVDRGPGEAGRASGVSAATRGDTRRRPSAHGGAWTGDRGDAVGGTEDSVGEFIDQEGGRRKVYPTVKEEVVPEGKGLRHSLLILQLPLQNH